MFSMKNTLIKLTFQLSWAKVNVKVAILRNVLLAVRCFHLWTDFDITSYTFWNDNILDTFVCQHNRVKV